MAANKGKKREKLLGQEDSGDNAHIPVSLRAPLLRMSAENAITGNIITIFIGVVDEQYTDNMWEMHFRRLSNLFHIDDPHCFAVIKVKNRGQDEIDAGQLGLDMSAAIDVINANVVQAIRIVGMGNRGAIGVHKAMEALVRGWNLPWDQKIVQFVALGDSQDHVYLMLCQNLCLGQICASVQFYNTMNYDNFGFLDLSRINLSQLNKEALEQLLAKLNMNTT